MPKPATAKSESLYGVSPGVAMVQKWMSELKGKTGRDLDEWIALLKKEGPKDGKSRREWLKTKHKLGTNSAWWIVECVEGKRDEFNGPEAYLEAAARYVEEQYSGPKQNLRPIYDALLAKGKKLGPDVKACPCKTIVPFYRQHVFAQIKPSTNTRVDLGLALAHYKGKLPKRLVDTGGLAKKDRITHRIEIKSLTEIDADVDRWLKIAYDLDA
jgi:Domain of unknown function (DUF5655)/Domain of unknown function (DUF4287)